MAADGSLTPRIAEPMKAGRFPFEDGSTTVLELRKRIPVYGEDLLRSALRAGCTTVPAVMAHLAARDGKVAGIRTAGSRKGATNSGMRGQSIARRKQA